MSNNPISLGKMAVALILVTGVASVSLGFIYAVTKEPIERVRLEKQLRAIEAVTGSYTNDPVAEQFDLNLAGEALPVYPAQVTSEEKVFAIKTVSSKGYSGDIVIMTGVDAHGAVNDVRVLSHAETPGLGSKIRDEKYIQQYLGKTMSDFDFRVKKDGGEVDAISGATISSRAFSEAVEKALNGFEQIEQ
ncbi:MAG: RnfABCDGE type electron transport complex subunit G [Bacteroidota bacterium]